MQTMTTMTTPKSSLIECTGGRPVGFLVHEGTPPQYRKRFMLVCRTPENEFTQTLLDLPQDSYFTTGGVA